jgi:hypothetical protein
MTQQIALLAHSDRRTPAWNSLNVLIAAQQACASFGIAYSAFGRKAANDPRLIYGLQKGRTLHPETETRVRTFISNLVEA